MYTQMSGKESEDETQEKKDGKEEKKENEGASASTAGQPKSFKKVKRVLRFQLPSANGAGSEESFTSALSCNWSNEDCEIPPRPSQRDLQLKKLGPQFTPPAMTHSQPKLSALSPCFQPFLYQNLPEEVSTDLALMQSSSSRQLFEVVKHSPTPSEADLNLINATYLRKLESVKEAIENGADVNTFRERQTPLLIATEIGDDRLVGYFLTLPKINPDFQNIFGQTPLIVAVRNAFDNIVRLLLSHNADVNITDHMGRTPLDNALFQQRPDMVKLLLAYGADYEKQDCFGEKPMYTCVVKKPHLECLMTLLKLGASPNYSTVTGIPLLCRAIMNWTEFRIVQVLVENGASVNAFDLNTGKTALHFAALIDDIRIAKFLVSKGANVNTKTAYNFTPYDEAIMYKSVNVAEYLVSLTINANPKLLQNLKNNM